jgi:hypothetical protein
MSGDKVYEGEFKNGLKMVKVKFLFGKLLFTVNF